MNWAREGALRIPPFQRRFRWDARDVERLFDSIWRGYPIGSLLLWRHEAPPARLDFGPVSLEAQARGDALFVVDGQQRLTSLIGTLLAPAGNGSPFELYFDLAGQAFRRAGRRGAPVDWLPLNEVVDTNALLSWLLAFRDRGGDEAQVAMATEVANRIRDYEIPTSVVETDDEVVLRDIFDRLNNFGRGLTRAEVFHSLHAALSGSQPADLRALIDEVSAFGFGTPREDTVLRSVLAVRGGDVFREFRDEFGDDEDPAQTYTRASSAIKRAFAFLQRDAAIPHVRLLPYGLVIPVLTRFFALHPEPAERNRLLLRRWVWRSAIAELGGGGGATAVLRRAVQAIGQDEHESVQQLLTITGHPDPAPIDLNAIQLNRAAARANVALLSTLEPRDLVTGEAIDVPALLDQHEVALVRITSTDAKTRSLANVFIHPPLSDDEVVPALISATPETLQSHGVTPQAYEFLRSSETDAFLQARGTELDDVLTHRRTALAEIAANDRPPLSALVVADDA